MANLCTLSNAIAVPIDKEYIDKCRATWETAILRPKKLQSKVELKDANTNQVISRSTNRVIQKDGQVSLMADLSVDANPKNACNVLCINRQYTAILMKDAGTTEWVIRQIVFPDQDPESHKMIQFRPKGQDFFSHLTVYYIPIYQILADEKSVKRFASSKSIDGIVNEIDFDYTLTGVPANLAARIYGTIVTDSRFSGVIKTAKYQVEAIFGKGTTDYKCQVQSDSEGHPVLISTITSGSYSDLAGKEIQSGIGTVEFEDLGTSTIKDEEFRISAYGLPEPVGVTWEEPSKPSSPTKPIPTYVWILCGAGCFAVLAIVFAFLRQRSLRKRAVAS